MNQPPLKNARCASPLSNPLWLRNPKAAWDSVKFRDWLIATLAANIADNKHEFTAISEPMLMSMDVLSKEFKPGMAGITPKSRNYSPLPKQSSSVIFSLLYQLVSPNERIDGKEVFTFGAGMRRRASVWLNSQEALQADVEFFLPFYVLPSSSHPPSPTFANARSICAGIVIRKSNDAAIGRDENNKELVAIRFNLRIPFTTQWISTSKSAPGRLSHQLRNSGDPNARNASRNNSSHR